MSVVRCGVELNTLEVDVGRVSNDVVLIFDDENESIFGFCPRDPAFFQCHLYVTFSGHMFQIKIPGAFDM